MPRNVTRVVMASAVAGAIIGSLSPRPLDSVEFAQVVSGLVVLPANASMAIPHGRIFSLLIDAPAVLLRAGLSVELVCRVMTMAMSALAFAALSLLGYVFTRNIVVAGLLPLAMCGYSLGASAHRYPIGLPITHNDLGANGLTLSLLALSLVALRSPWGAFALALLPGIHASWSVGVLLLVASGALLDRSARLYFQQRWPWLVAGVVIAATGWALHVVLAPVFPTGPEINPELVRGLERYWDPHRRPIGADTGTLIAMFAGDAVFIVLSLVALRGAFARRRGVRFWLSGALVVAALALTNSMLDEFWPGALPLPLSALLMSRWLNLNTVALPALTTGLLLYPLTAQSRRRFVATGVAAAIAALAIGPVVIAWGKRNFAIESTLVPAGDRELLDRVRLRDGMMLTVSPLSFAQLHTGRPQLLDLSLVDVVQYAPRAAVPMEAILTDVFGASLLRPELAEEQMADLEDRWSRRTVDEWRAIRRRYGVTEVMVAKDWHLTLPPIESSASLVVYSIPAP